jgi:hypothetical protein
MTQDTARLTFVLSCVAAALAFAAALIGFIRQRELNVPYIGAACLLLAFGLNAARQIRKGPRA